MTKERKIPKISIALSFVALIWTVAVFSHWGYRYPDPSQLIFSCIISLGILYVAYDQWHKKMVEDWRHGIKRSDIMNLKNDISELNKAMDSMDNYVINNLEKLKDGSTKMDGRFHSK